MDDHGWMHVTAASSAFANEVNICNVSLTHVARYNVEVSGQKGGKCFSRARRQEGRQQSVRPPHCSSSFHFNLVNNANALQRRPVNMTIITCLTIERTGTTNPWSPR